MAATTTNPPRAIAGSPGRRIRVILGETGSDYLLKVEKDDGTRKQQSCVWNNIPVPLSKQIDNCTAKGRYVTNVDFCSKTDAWFVTGKKRDGSGEHSWCSGASSSDDILNLTRHAAGVQVLFGCDSSGEEQSLALHSTLGGYAAGNCDPNLISRIERILKSGKSIDCLRLFNDRGYFISDDEGSDWNGLINAQLANELSKPGKVNDVAVAGDGSWIVIREDSYVGSVDLGKALTDKLGRFYREEKLCMDIRTLAIQSYHAQLIERPRQEREQDERRKALLEARERKRELARERARQELEQEEREAREEATERHERERARERVLQEREREEKEAARKATEQERDLRDRELEVERSRRDRNRLDSLSAQELAGWSGSVNLASLASPLEENIKEEVIFIEEQTKLNDQQKQKLRKRRCELKALMEKLPPAQRARIGLKAEVMEAETTERTDCVICHSASAIRAIIPCGHQCLCDDCSDSLSILDEASRLCPLCRTPLQSTLKIYGARK